MKIVKKILIGLAVLVGVLLIAALFVKKDFAVKREVVINKPVPEVFNYIKYLKNQDNYSVWAKMDPAMKKEYRGTDGTVGFVSAWEGNSDVGKGEQKITGITDDKEVDFELHFIKPFESISPAYLKTEPASAGSTTVTWGMSGNMTYPFNLMRLFMDMDKAIGNDFQTGLDNLKVILEK